MIAGHSGNDPGTHTVPVPAGATARTGRAPKERDSKRSDFTGSATYYTISDRNYWVGTVALVNSLRLTGHSGEIVVLDRGLTEELRNALAPQCTLIRFDAAQISGLEKHPFLAKPYPHLFDARGTVVLIDSDMIVTHSLDHVLEPVDGGRICAFADATLPTRWFNDWEVRLTLRSPLRRQTYVNAGFVALSTAHWPDFLARWWELCRAVLSCLDDDPGGVFRWRDQDALNALLMSETPEDALLVLPKSQAPMLDELAATEIVEAKSLAATVHGEPTMILHNAGPIKPWDRRKWYRLHRNAYMDLLPRLLFADDVAVRMEPEQVPLWLRPGTSARFTMRNLTFVSGAMRRTVHAVPSLTRLIRSWFPPDRPGA